MPIHFRCPSCFGLLSNARRKAGTEVACPKCGDAVIVPADDGSPDEEDPQNAEFEAEAESIRAAELPPPPPPREPSQKLPPLPPREQPAARKREAVGVSTESRSAPPSPPLERKPKPAPGKAGKDETPLFERDDFERLLTPAAQKAATPSGGPSGSQGAKGLTRSTPAAPLAPSEAELATGEKGIFISQASALMLAIMGFVLIGLAFAAGFLVGS